MTTTTNENTNAAWAQAKQEGGQRAKRIYDIFKAAIAESFGEVKLGSGEFYTIFRKALADWLKAEQNNASPRPAGATPAAAVDEETAPTLKDLLSQAAAKVQDRRGDWAQQFKAHWREQAAKLDADMADNYGDRYGKAKSLFQKASTWLADLETSPTSTVADDVKPVAIEVIEEEETAPLASQDPQPKPKN